MPGHKFQSVAICGNPPRSASRQLIWRNVLRGIFENHFTQKNPKNILQHRRNELKNKSFYVKLIFSDHRCAKIAFGRDMLIPQKMVDICSHSKCVGRVKVLRAFSYGRVVKKGPHGVETCVFDTIFSVSHSPLRAFPRKSAQKRPVKSIKFSYWLSRVLFM